MGKLTLLLVAAAILGGSLLTYSAQRLSGGTEGDRRSAQADLLARQIAESGHAVVLAAIMGTDGFRTPAISTRSYEGGQYRVSYDPASTSTRATFVVSGDYRGATHTIQSTYEWDPLEYPGPIWLDVPYATADVASGADVSGGPGGLRVQFDRRKHDEFGLEPLVPLGTMEGTLATAFATTASGYQSGRAAASWPGLLEDLNVGDAEGLYQAALAETPETTLAGPHTVTGNETGVGAADQVTHVTGDLTVASGGMLRGAGALVVDGLLTVEDGARFTWSGIVITRSEDPFMPVRLEGAVDLTGGLVVVQNAYPPGGHMDVTVWRDLDTGLSAGNVRGEPALAPWAGLGEPFLQHLHRFDLDLGTRRVAFLQDGDAVDSQEPWTQFEDTLDRLGSEEVYLAFENEAEHGYAHYLLDVDGEAEPYAGTVQGGFGGFADESDSHRTRGFRADRLDDFVVDVKSLQGLRARFDGEGGCDALTQWPRCIGSRWDRGGVLRVQLRKAATDQLLYESGLYWHMQDAERADYQARVDAWRAQIQGGALFGTRLELGDDVDISFSMAPVYDLVERLRFDGNEVVHVGSESRHRSYDEGRALATRTDGQVEVCHQAGTASEQTRTIAPDEIDAHLRHGDVFVACDGTPASGGPPATPTMPTLPAGCASPSQLIKVCRPPYGGDTSWNDFEVTCSQAVAWVANGALAGTCSDNSPLPTAAGAFTPPTGSTANAAITPYPAGTCPAGWRWQGGGWACP